MSTHNKAPAFDGTVLRSGRLGLMPRRYQSGEANHVGGISKAGERRVWSLLYEGGEHQ
jgi:transposase